ncbi:aminotransferase protein [Thiohalobacter thiocyanaticus]|uniref:Aminotransferase protein n=1 Tax=Thiohalobacter thiocyanaticus TaxID=585455 RepID=A0A1Z4VT11_9GAMM|nr:DegT/DnrJ/EryC1/StrS aminotransferase family protein [Thiohalobacter thiocyanaticus]BAZ94542.1 aminotransferase protein [Thiohalobacter thiocyanaticus]
MLNGPFSPWPSFTQEEADAVNRVLLSNHVNYWTGEECRSFEREFSDWCGADYAVSLANGTVALELALKILDVGPGDEVVVTPRTFIASASAVVAVGATPVFADIDRDSQNITAHSIESVLSSRTRAVICVHLAGWPCDMDDIMDLATRHSLYVVEDCAQAHGAIYRCKSVGSIGHVGAWSFCQDKIMTTGGEGGMLTTNDEALWKKAWAYKDHGKSFDAVFNREHTTGFRWLHESFGTNWRMTEMQAAIGRIQLLHMREWHSDRKRNADTISSAARNIEALRVSDVPADIEHAWYKYYVFVRTERLMSGWNRDRILGVINEKGVPCFSGSCSEVYLEKAFDDTGWRPEPRLPVAKELGETSLMFLVHPTLSGDEIDKTCDVLTDVLRHASR